MPRIPVRRLVKPIVCAVLSGMALVALLACDTPVYRYAMYRWEPEPYELYFFHDQPAGNQDQAVAQAVKELAGSEKQPANLQFFDVNLAEDKEMQKISPAVKQAFLAKADHKLPAYLAVSSYGQELAFGPLDEAAARSLIDSPVRRELASQLAQGKIGVFLLVPCSKAEENAQAEAILKSLVDDMNAGKLDLPGIPAAPAADDGSAAPPKVAHEMGMLEVKRDDAREQWLLKMLIGVEDDLKKEDVPIVFLSYGRGRVLLPYLGKGITRENLTYEIEFISGACSCTVKEQNPGVDLLVRQNWEEAARLLAEKFGAEEGNPYGPGSFYPELVIPSGAASPEMASATPGTNTDDVVTPAAKPATNAAQPATPAASAPANDPPKSATETKPQPAAAPPVAAPPAAAKSSPAAKDSNPPVAAQPPAGKPDDKASGAARAARATSRGEHRTPTEPAVEWYSSAYIVGAGIAVGLGVLFLMTVWVLRPHH